VTRKVVVVDHGIGNLLSVRRAFEHCEATVDLSRDPDRVAGADRLVLPGVGAFGDVMMALRKFRLVDPILRYAERDRPFLGICVGLQVMMDSGTEFGAHDGLGLIPGRCLAIPPTSADGTPHKIPHIGWNKLIKPATCGGWEGTVLEGVRPASAVYFVHAFTAEPDDDDHRLADSDYNGRRVAAALQRGTLFGCQFHPEKSGPVGLLIIDRFLSL